MKKNLILIGILVTALVLSSAVALMNPGSSTSAGIGINTFTTDSKVYVTHLTTLSCGDVAMESKTVNVYVVADKNWTNGDAIADYVANTTVTTDSDAKLQASLIWETPQVGSYDIIVDINKNGNYDDSIDCSELIDGNKGVAGFTVLQATAPAENQTAPANQTVTAQNATINATLNQTVTAPATTTPATTQTTATPTLYTGNETKTTETGKSDYIPFIIIGISIVIAALIIAFTLRRMR